VKAVISGAGAAGLLHALALRASRVEIAAIYDPDAARAHALAEACHAGVARSFDELVATDATIASVCSPPSLHLAQAEALARGGRFVFVEKPVATTVDELDRLRALPRCVPVVQWRAGRGIRALRRAIAHGEFGRSPVASCDLAWGRDDAYFRARGASWGAGALLSIGIHALDALAWALGGKIEAVSGMSAPPTRAHAFGETAAVALLRFSGGALASIRISLDGGADTTRIVLCGRGVTATIEGGEADPTATAVTWSALDDGTRARLAALERDTPGALGPPLLVPYFGAATSAIRDGVEPGDNDRLPSIADTYDAHAVAMCITENSGPASARAA
jgi:predicted dehydrogenase